MNFDRCRRGLRGFAVSAFLLAIMACTGCAHYVAKDYPQYLENNRGHSTLPETSAASQYYLPKKTAQYSYTFHAFTTGIGNAWIVDVGKMLDDQLQSADVQKAFDGLTKVSSPTASSPGLLTFDLERYDFSHFAAHIVMKITLESGGQTVLSKTYKVTGKSQGAKMFWAGSFGQKNAVQQSTKTALDDILRQLIGDMRALHLPSARQS